MGSAATVTSTDADGGGIVYIVQDGELVPTYECSWSATSLSCSQDGEFVFSTAGQRWREYPLPEGKVVNAEPNGWWVVQGDRVLPADATAAQYADGPVSMEEFQSIAIAHGGAPWSEGVFGVGWPFVFVAIALVAFVVIGMTVRRRSRTRGRPDSPESGAHAHIEG